jgi:hypothetical protein
LDLVTEPLRGKWQVGPEGERDNLKRSRLLDCGDGLAEMEKGIEMNNPESNTENDMPVREIPLTEETLGVTLARDRLKMEIEFAESQAKRAKQRILDAEMNLSEELRNQDILRGNGNKVE